MTIFLPVICALCGRMAGTQPITVVYLDTPAARWEDTSEARARLDAAFRWWEVQVDVTFTVTEHHATIDADPHAFDICHDRAWAEGLSGVVMVAGSEWFTCDGVQVVDYAGPGQALISALAYPDELAHTLGHFYGASDKHAIGEPGDIMDYRVLGEAYHDGLVNAQTLAEIGATRRVASAGRDPGGPPLGMQAGLGVLAPRNRVILSYRDERAGRRF